MVWQTEIEEQIKRERRERSVQPNEREMATKAGQNGAVAVSADDFSALEDRILRAVDLVKRERSGRTEAEERAGKAEALAAERKEEADSLRAEVAVLKAERDHVRERVERLVAQLDALEV